MPNKGIFIIGAKRTPFCSYGGPLRELPASHAFAAAAKDALQSAHIDASFVDQTVVGNIHYLSQCDGGKTPRYCGIYSGVPLVKPALGVSKSCGTGLQALITSAVDILFGSSNICLTGGTEIMSSLPMLVRNVRFGTALGVSYTFEDHIQRQLADSYSGLTLSQIAEGVAKKYQIGRRDADEFALTSHMKWKAAQDSNAFKEEITGLTVTLKNKEFLVDKDEILQTDMSKEYLDQLPLLVENGKVVTTGNSSVAADGAAALLMASEEAVRDHDLRPMARVSAWATVGVDPKDTGTGAATAVTKLLADQGIRVDDVDLFEINETFAPLALAAIRELQLDLSKVNVKGGALVLGNPVAATGARMVTSLVHELRRRNVAKGVAASSCGGGQGVAVLIENV